MSKRLWWFDTMINDSFLGISYSFLNRTTIPKNNNDFSKEKIQELLHSKSGEEQTISQFLELLKNCEMARYAPFSNVEMKQDYDKASNVISLIDRQIK